MEIFKSRLFMKQLRAVSKHLLTFLIVILLFSCQSDNKNATEFIKKYSEYTDLEKMNLKGEVIGLKDYDDHFYFFNEKGMIEKEFHNENIWSVYDYSNNRLLNIFSGNLGSGDLWLTNFEYESGFILTKTSFDLIEQVSSYQYKYKNDVNGFPIEEFFGFEPNDKIASTKFFRNNLKLDSSYKYVMGDLSSKFIYADGREGKYIEFDDFGGVDKENSCDFNYEVDIKGNDFKKKSIFLSGKVDSAERVILYKGDDLTKYSTIYSTIFSNMLRKDNSSKSDKNSQ